MGITKKINWGSVFIFLFLAIFPFGQIIRTHINLFGLTIPLQPIDIVVFLGAIYSIFFEKTRTLASKYIGYFLVAAAFSFLISIFYFKEGSLYGLFYLVRLTSYSFFLNYVWNFVKKKNDNKKLLVESLLGVSVISAIFGWFQYFTLPDLKPLFYIGWDMHLYRLVGTFLDPTYLGLIIVFGSILSVSGLIKTHEKKYLLITIFLLISLAFTYSRASYLAFTGGIFVLAFTEKKFRKILLWAVGLLALALILPTAKNHSIEITRIPSIEARLKNYSETLNVFGKYPVLGVGYNNMCVARNTFIGEEEYSSHACSGSDSSLLLILATTGVVGLMVFAGSVGRVFKLVKKGHYSQILIASSVALLVHSMFSNSLFFPWIMGYMTILLAISLKE